MMEQKRPLLFWKKTTEQTSCGPATPPMGIAPPFRIPVLVNPGISGGLQLLFLGGVVVMAQNYAGYTSSYTIDRLCQLAQDPLAVGSNCSKSSYQVTTVSYTHLRAHETRHDLV